SRVWAGKLACRPCRYDTPARAWVASATHEVFTRSTCSTASKTTASIGDGLSGCLSVERSRFYPFRAEVAAARTVAGVALLARALSIGALGRRRRLVTGGVASRFLRALPEARAVVDAEAPEMSEAALRRHERDPRSTGSPAAQHALPSL